MWKHCWRIVRTEINGNIGELKMSILQKCVRCTTFMPFQGFSTAVYFSIDHEQFSYIGLDSKIETFLPLDRIGSMDVCAGHILKISFPQIECQSHVTHNLIELPESDVTFVIRLVNDMQHTQQTHGMELLAPFTSSKDDWRARMCHTRCSRLHKIAASKNENSRTFYFRQSTLATKFIFHI